MSSLERCIRKHQRSQHHEDLVLLPALLSAVVYAAGSKGWLPGTFVELGALDGERLSNTHLLEKCFGWTGLLIEAQPDNAAALVKSGRQAEKRFSGICEPKGTLLMTGRGSDVAGQIGAMSETYLLQFGKTNGGNVMSNARSVPCMPLRDLMAGAGLAKGADFLSLDVEGAEELVIRTVDPSIFRVIMVEMDQYNLPKNARVDAYIRRAGLRRNDRDVTNRTAGSIVYFNRGVAMHADLDAWARLDQQIRDERLSQEQKEGMHLEFMFKRAIEFAGKRWRHSTSA